MSIKIDHEILNEDLKNKKSTKDDSEAWSTYIK